MLPAIITLQRQFRARKKINSVPSKIKFGLGDIQPICYICNIKNLEIICRVCEQAVFCHSCFLLFHQAKIRRNHKFYSIQPRMYNEFSFNSNEEQIRQFKKDVYENIKNSIDQLSRKLSYYSNMDIIDVNYVREELNTISSLKNRDDLIQKAMAIV